jgi:hypothetical protein
MTSVVNTSLYLPIGKREVTREAAEASVIQDLLCYDTVFVHTDQMEAVGVLCGVMGAPQLIEALDSGALRFIHDRHILSWPVPKPGYMGVTPIVPMASMGMPDASDPGFTERSTADSAHIALRGFNLDRDTERVLLSRVAATTVEMQWPQGGQSSGRTLAEGVSEDLRTYADAVVNIDGFPVSAGEILRLIRDLKHPRKSPLHTRHFTVAKMQTQSGAKLLEAQKAYPPKQLAMLSLALADRFLVAHRSVGLEATLHTEPLVEQVLAAKAARIRRAAAGEVDVVLNAEKVSLPVLVAPAEFPYRELLAARERRDAQEFRSVVRDRDTSGDELLQAYLRSLGGSLSGRFSVKLVRWLVGNAVGVLGPIAGMALSAADTFFLDGLMGRATARYFVDETLRRIATGAPSRARIEVRD